MRLHSRREFDELVADIKANGLIEQIIVFEDTILDGRNRVRACEIAGVAPTYTVYSGDDPAAYVISANIRRRHLDQAQKRDLIAKLLKAQPEKSDRQIAKTVKASPTTVGTVRAEMEAAGDVSKLDTRTDTKGRKQPTRVGRDGKRRRLRTAPQDDLPTAEEAEESWQETLYDQACLLLEQMADETRQRFFAHIKEKYKTRFAEIHDDIPDFLRRAPKAAAS
jgi:ParB-like chromosome segregation protein Spo0J